MKVCYIGAYDPQYARNQILLKGLALNDVEVVECCISPHTRLWKRNLALIAQFLKIPHDFDLFLVAGTNQLVMPLIKMLGKIFRKPVAFDVFYSIYDAYVHDRKHVRKQSIKARLFYMLDVLGLRLADCVLADTEQHRTYYRAAFSMPDEKIQVLYVGCDTSLFQPIEFPPEPHKFTVTFTGTFIPLHGIEYILRAAKLLEAESDIHVELIGTGQTYPAMQHLAEELALRNCTFFPPVPIAELPTLMAHGDICLGIFGDSQKAKRVIPNKVFQALAMRKGVITGDSPAIREIFTPDEHLCVCNFSDEYALADAILRLKHNAALRARIAQQGYQLITERFNPLTLGKQLKDMLEVLR